MRVSDGLIRLAAGLVLATVFVPANGHAWTVTQLTNNNTDDRSPRICGSNIVWEGDGFIHYYDGKTTRCLTDGSYYASWPSISETTVVWTGGRGDYTEIYSYDLATGVTTQLTNNTYIDECPKVWQNKVTWSAGLLGEIFYYDGTETMRLTYNGHTDMYPKVWGDYVVWCGRSGSDLDVLLYDGNTIRAIADDDYADSVPKIHGNLVVWQRYDGLNYDNYLYDIEKDSTTRLTDNDYTNFSPVTDGQRVAWSSKIDGVTGEIFLYDSLTGETQQITNNSGHDTQPCLSWPYMAWVGQGELGSEIFVQNLISGERWQLTDNDVADIGVCMDGDTIVWQAGEYDNYEIYMATIPEPASLTFLLAGAALFIKKRRKG